MLDQFDLLHEVQTDLCRHNHHVRFSGQSVSQVLRQQLLIHLKKSPLYTVQLEYSIHQIVLFQIGDAVQLPKPDEADVNLFASSIHQHQRVGYFQIQD